MMKMHTRGAKWLSCAVGLGVVVGAVNLAAFSAPENLATSDVVAPVEPEQFHRYYFKEKQEMQLEPNQLLAYRAPERGTLKGELDHFGIDSDHIQPWDLPGWFRVWLTPESRKLGAVDGPDLTARELVATVASDASVDFVSPVFRGYMGRAFMFARNILVRFREGVTDEQADEIITSRQLGEIWNRDFAGLERCYRIRFVSGDGFKLLDAANDLATLSQVRFGEPSLIGEGGVDSVGEECVMPTIPADVGSGSSRAWGIDNDGSNISCAGILSYPAGNAPNFDMDAPEAWCITEGDPDILVLVMDGGAGLSSQADTVAARRFDDCIDEECSDCDYAGTSVIGGIGGHALAVSNCVAARNDGNGTVGVAPGCRILSAQVQISGGASAEAMSAALAWGISLGARVSTTSSNMVGPTSCLADKYADAVAHGMINFGSSGNNCDATVEPGREFTTVHAVGAADASGKAAGFSNFGAGVDGDIVEIVAPGVCNRTSVGPSMSGTSFASPYAAGIAALVISYNPCFTVLDVEKIMRSAGARKSISDSSDPTCEASHGFPNADGLINALDALRLARDKVIFDGQVPIASVTTSRQGPAPCRFALVSPGDGFTVSTRVPFLKWDRSDGATTYTVEIAADSTFANIIHINSILQQAPATVCYRVPSGILTTNAVFYWRVSAVNGNGTRRSAREDSRPLELGFRSILMVHCLGDADHDGFVDIDDATFVLENICTTGPGTSCTGGTCGEEPCGDADGDGDVDVNDVFTVFGHLNETCSVAENNCGGGGGGGFGG